MTNIMINSEYLLIEDDRVHLRRTLSTSKKHVLLLHGASFNARTWEEIGTVGALMEADYNSIAVDLPGFARSYPTHLAPNAWLEQLLEVLKLNRPVILSPSMSGRYALPYITQHPDDVAGFIAVAPVGIGLYAKDLPKISAPVLAIWGENDRTVPLEDGKTLAATVQQGEFVLVPNGSHAPYMNDADFFHDRVLQFLRKCF